MPNSVSGFYQTLVNEVSEASKLLGPTLNLSGSCFWDYAPAAATIGQTLNVVIPGDPTGSVAVDSGLVDPTITDIAFTTVPIVMDKHACFSFLIRDFEQFNSPAVVRRVFANAALTAVKNKINATIASLLVVANFPSNRWDTTNKTWTGAGATAIYPVAGQSGKVLSVAEFLSQSATGNGGLLPRLTDQNVPTLDNVDDMSLLVPSIVYGRLMDPTTSGSTNDPAWTQSLQAGQSTTEQVHGRATFPTVYGMKIKLDQQMPSTGVAPTRTFTCCYLHRWAIAVVARPMPLPGSNVEYEYINMTQNTAYPDVPGGMKLPIRVQFWYRPDKLGWQVVIDAGFGMKVVRDNMCILFNVSE